MLYNIKDRLLASGIHFLISLLVSLILGAIAYFSWFPGDLIKAGALTGFSILIAVDITLGPLLTFFVFDKTKEKLKFDLTCLALLQIVCLCIGIWLIYSQRPVAQVLAEDGIHILAKDDAEHFNSNIKIGVFERPKFLIQDLPETLDEISQVKFTSEFVEERPFIYRSDLYLDVTLESLTKRIKLIDEALRENQKEEIQNLESHDCSWVPLHSKHRQGYACITLPNGIKHISKPQ